MEGDAIQARRRPVAMSLPQTGLHRVKHAILQARNALLKLQNPQGYWWAELESNVTITAEYLMLHRFLGLEESHVPRMAADILARQGPNGAWSLWYRDGGNLSTTVEAYLALKMAGVPAEDECLVKARQYILANGGALKTRVFTRIFMALFGQVSWDGVPLLPVEFMFLPPWSGLSIYELSSWTRATAVSLMIIMAKRPVCPLPPEQGVMELFLDPSEPFHRHRMAWKVQNSFLENLFTVLDRILKLYYHLPLPWLRRMGIKRAKEWILAHQEETGDWAGIQPAMLYSILALYCLGYEVTHDVMHRGLHALEFFTLKDGDRLWLQSCISPVWDTALVVRALYAAGISPEDLSMRKATLWLLSKQIFAPGDWCVKCPDLAPGGWAFEFANNWYPDIDDSSVVLLALKEGLAQPARHREALQRGIDWCLGMQSKNGGYASFAKDNTKEWLNAIPFGDLKALLDPPTEDITGRVLEMMGAFGYSLDHPRATKALDYLKRTQHRDGSWWGRWGVNYIYGTWSVLTGLKAIGEDMNRPYVRRAVQWLKDHQNQDGGWGETCDSYKDSRLKGTGASTASQTAWALMGLIAAGEALSPEVRAGVEYLVKTQTAQGCWDEAYFTGTGFPSHFMIRYHLYRDCFPLQALGQYVKAVAHPGTDV